MELGGCVLSELGNLRDFGVGLEEGVDVGVGVRRWAGEVVVMRDGDDVGSVLGGGEALRDGREPGGVAGDVGKAEVGVGDAGADGVGGGEPLVEVGVGVPVGFYAEAVVEDVRLVAKLEASQSGKRIVKNAVAVLDAG